MVEAPAVSSKSPLGRKKKRRSSKRFNSFAALVMLCGVIVAAVLGHKVDSSIIYTLGSIVIGASALTLAERRGPNDSQQGPPYN